MPDVGVVVEDWREERNPIRASDCGSVANSPPERSRVANEKSRIAELCESRLRVVNAIGEARHIEVVADFHRALDSPQRLDVSYPGSRDANRSCRRQQVAFGKLVVSLGIRQVGLFIKGRPSHAPCT